jgi:hypothetical protein
MISINQNVTAHGIFLYFRDAILAMPILDNRLSF